jgi:hypothetical protein
VRWLNFAAAWPQILRFMALMQLIAPLKSEPLNNRGRMTWSGG